MQNNQEIDQLIAQSQGCDGGKWLSPETQQWLGGLTPQLPKRFQVHSDRAAHEAAAKLGVPAFVLSGHIFLGDMSPNIREPVLRHELVHLAQVQLARQTGRIAPSAKVEQEAEDISALPVALPAQFGAHPHQAHPIFWVPIIVGAMIVAYICTDSTPANAPGPKEKVLPRKNDLQPYGDAILMFAVPAGAFSIGGRLGFGFLRNSVFANALTLPSIRAYHDFNDRRLSPPSYYLFDTVTGALLGFVMGGGVKLIARPYLEKIDTLAQYGLLKEDIRIARAMAEHVPQTVEEAEMMLNAYGLKGRIALRWINRRGLIVGYRGQDRFTDPVVSPYERKHGAKEADAFYQRLQDLEISDDQIREWMAKFHDTDLHPAYGGPAAGTPGGGLSLPTTTKIGIAAGFAPGEDGVIYLLRMPKDKMVLARGFAENKLEYEHGVIGRIPPGSILQVFSRKELGVPALTIDRETGRVVPGYSVGPRAKK